jgi:hypothetical protein
MNQNDTTERVYNCIAKSFESMTLGDIALKCGLASRSVALYHVRKLADAGRIIFTPGTHRSIRLAEAVNANQ